jgi:protein-tyrosine kinase
VLIFYQLQRYTFLATHGLPPDEFLAGHGKEAMSRIHEALKKAEEERAILDTADVAALPVSTINAGTEAMKATAAVRKDEAGVIAPEEHHHYLRFDDLQTHCARTEWHPNPNENIFNPAQDGHAAEQFRTLRSRLYQLRGSQQLRTLLVTSSVVAEGKTFVTSNLAHAIVRQPDRRCLIIDADLRCSRLHASLGAKSAPGLTDYLRGEADEVAVIHRGPDHNLFLIPGGHEVSNPSELLSNGRLKKLLDRVAPIFDWIILDSPPCLPVADASVLAEYCDGLLLVVKAGSTPLAIVQRAQQELQGRNIVGVVLNTVEQEALAYSSYYASSYYGLNRTNNPENRKLAR